MRDTASRIISVLTAIILLVSVLCSGIDNKIIRKRLDTLEEKVYNTDTRAFASPVDYPYEDEEANVDYEYIVRVITTEGGYDREICLAVTQCLYNACEKYDWKYTPRQMLEMYHYAYPSNVISDEAMDAYYAIFVAGERYSAVQNATIFYAPKYCHSDYHESQIFITEINGVKFFEERK